LRSCGVMFRSLWVWERLRRSLTSCTDFRDTFVQTKPGMKIEASMSCKYLNRLLLKIKKGNVCLILKEQF